MQLSISGHHLDITDAIKQHAEENGFSYEEWVNPPAGHFYENYKRELDDINNQMAPPLQYQS